MKGFVLVLVVEDSQAQHDTEAVARVCRDFEVETVGDLEREIECAGWQANNLLRRQARDGMRIASVRGA